MREIKELVRKRNKLEQEKAELEQEKTEPEQENAFLKRKKDIWLHEVRKSDAAFFWNAKFKYDLGKLDRILSHGE